jgi:hypothetical protein
MTNQKSSRRTFFMQCAAIGALGMSGIVAAQPAQLSETDPQASALGYKSDAATVDHAKYPKYAAGQNCSSCQLFQGKGADAAGPCPIFSGKLVSAKGWCSAYTKKA